MEIQLKPGNICYQRCFLADLIVKVVEVSNDGRVIVSNLDSPEGTHKLVKREDLVLLAEKQELESGDFIGAIDKQREIEFTPVRRRQKKDKTQKEAKNQKESEVQNGGGGKTRRRKKGSG